MGYRQIIEDHLPLLRTQAEPMELEPSDAYRFDADLFGLLSYHGYSTNHHYVIERVNRYTSPMDYRYFHPAPLIPDLQYVTDLHQFYRGQRRLERKREMADQED